LNIIYLPVSTNVLETIAIQPATTYDTDDRETDQESSGTTSAEGTTRANEETSADTATNGNHVQVSGLQCLVELVVLVGERTAPEGVGCHTEARQKRRPFGVVVFAIGVRRRLRKRAIKALDLSIDCFLATRLGIGIGVVRRHARRIGQLPEKVLEKL
jgi:hypothetical protein